MLAAARDPREGGFYNLVVPRKFLFWKELSHRVNKCSQHSFGKKDDH